jgi:cell division protein FtsB
MKFWEIPAFLVCPVVGQCLTIAEQRQVLKRTNMQSKKMTHHELHEMLVSCSNDENRLSTRVDALLQRKFGREVYDLLQMAPGAFMSHYRNAFKAGDYCAALWAAAVHPGLSVESQREVFGEVHMAMHFSGDERMKMVRKMNTREKKIEEMTEKTRVAVEQRRALQKENARLKRMVSDLEAEMAVLGREKEVLALSLSRDRSREAVDPYPENGCFRSEMAFLQDELDRTRRRETVMAAENERLMKELEQQRETALLFRRETREVICRMKQMGACSPNCPAFDLCKKRILIVGGIARMESLYRDLIETANGIFEYHDGHVKKGAKQLESRLKRADIVLCPVNCNSHGACSLVKNLAKKHQKTVHMMPNFSLSAVSSVINGGDTVQASLN